MTFVRANPFAEANPGDSSITHTAMCDTEHSAVNDFRKRVHTTSFLGTGRIQFCRFARGDWI